MKHFRTQITNSSIESAGLVKDPYQALAEYIWNGFDADAHTVTVDFISNELGHLSQIRISDDGTGIPYPRLAEAFGNFLDSAKRKIPKRTSYTRGRKVKGRFSFSLFATRAKWDTRYADSEHDNFGYSIQIARDNKQAFDFTEPAPTTRGTGTTVELEGIFGLSASALASEDFEQFLAQEFGWFLLLNKKNGRQLMLNGIPLAYTQIIDETDHRQWTISADEDTDYVFEVQYTQWKVNIGDRYYYYFLNGRHLEVAKVLSSFNNNAISFHHSVFIQSTFFDDFFQNDMALAQEDNLFSERLQQVVYRKLQTELRDLLSGKQKKFILEKTVEHKIKQIADQGLLPSYTDSADDQHRQHTLLQLIKIIYAADPRSFVGVKPSFTQSYISFLDLLLQSDQRAHLVSVLTRSTAFGEKDRQRLEALLS